METGTRPGFSTVLVNLPILTSDERAEYDTFEVSWRRLGSEIWESTTTSSRSTNVTLPGELADGSYEVRVRAQGFGGASLYTMPLRFPLRNGQTTVTTPTKAPGKRKFKLTTSVAV